MVRPGQVRVIQFGLAAAQMVTDPLPVPPEGAIVSQSLHGLIIDQEQPLPAMTFTVMLVPVAGGFQVAGLVEKWGTPAPRVALKISPAMLNVALRPAPFGF